MSGGGAYVSGSDDRYFMTHEFPFSISNKNSRRDAGRRVWQRLGAKRDGASPVSTVDLLVSGHGDAHVVDHARGKLAGFHLGGAFHQALEIVSYFSLFDGALQALLDQIGGFGPSKMAEHHNAGQNDGAGIDDVFVRVLGSGAVGRFEDGIAIADVRSGSDAEAADLRGACIGDVVAVQVRRSQD